MKRLAVRAIIKVGVLYLLVQRLDGRWEFPGGKTDGQQPLTALKRELKEETGLDTITATHSYTIHDKQSRFHTTYYRVHARGRIKLQASEVKAYKWASKSEIRKLNTTLATKRIIGMI